MHNMMSKLCYEERWIFLVIEEISACRPFLYIEYGVNYITKFFFRFLLELCTEVSAGLKTKFLKLLFTEAYEAYRSGLCFKQNLRKNNVMHVDK